VMHDAQCGRSMSRAVGSRSLKASMPLAEILLVRRTALASGHATTRSSRTSIWAAINCAGPATVREARRRAAEPSVNPVLRLSGGAAGDYSNDGQQPSSSRRPLRWVQVSSSNRCPTSFQTAWVRPAGRRRPSGSRRFARSGGTRPAAGAAGCRTGAPSGSTAPARPVRDRRRRRPGRPASIQAASRHRAPTGAPAARFCRGQPRLRACPSAFGSACASLRVDRSFGG
jgi:hypothetical protein